MALREGHQGEQTGSLRALAGVAFPVASRAAPGQAREAAQTGSADHRERAAAVQTGRSRLHPRQRGRSRTAQGACLVGAFPVAFLGPLRAERLEPSPAAAETAESPVALGAAQEEPSLGAARAELLLAQTAKPQVPQGRTAGLRRRPEQSQTVELAAVPPQRPGQIHPALAAVELRRARLESTARLVVLRVREHWRWARAARLPRPHTTRRRSRSGSSRGLPWGWPRRPFPLRERHRDERPSRDHRLQNSSRTSCAPRRPKIAARAHDAGV